MPFQKGNPGGPRGISGGKSRAEELGLPRRDYENNDLVFCTSIGTPLQPRNVIGRHLKPIL
jgi:hypothetical protein